MQKADILSKQENLYSVLTIEETAGFTLPEWAKAVYSDQLLVLLKYNLGIFIATAHMKKIRGRPFIADIINKMTKKAEGSLEPNRNIYVYSGHDTTLVAAMSSLEIIDETSNFPDYGATLAVELHKYDNTSDHKVKAILLKSVMESH